MNAKSLVLWSGVAALLFLAARRGASDAVNSLVPDLPDFSLPDAQPLFLAPHQAPPLVRDLSEAEKLARGLRPL